MKYFIEVLVDQNLVTPEQLANAFVQQAAAQPSVMEVVHRSGLFAPNDFVAMCIDQVKCGGSLADAGRRLGVWTAAADQHLSNVMTQTQPTLVDILRRDGVLTQDILTNTLESMSKFAPPLDLTPNPAPVANPVMSPILSVVQNATTATPAQIEESFDLTAPSPIVGLKSTIKEDPAFLAQVAIDTAAIEDHLESVVQALSEKPAVEVIELSAETTGMLAQLDGTASASGAESSAAPVASYDLSDDLSSLVAGSSFSEFLTEEMKNEIVGLIGKLKETAQDASGWTEAGEGLFHAMHSVKGASRFLGESLLERLTDEAEKLLEFVTKQASSAPVTSRETIVSTLELINVTIWKIRDCRAQDRSLPPELVGLTERACAFADDVASKMITGGAEIAQAA